MLDTTLAVQQAGHHVYGAFSLRDDNLWSETLAIPFYVSCGSGLLLLIHNIASSAFFRRFLTHLGWSSGRQTIYLDVKGLSGRVAAHGGALIFTAEVIRLAGCATAAGLSICWTLAVDGAKKRENGLFCLTLVRRCFFHARSTC